MITPFLKNYGLFGITGKKAGQYQGISLKSPPTLVSVQSYCMHSNACDFILFGTHSMGLKQSTIRSSLEFTVGSAEDLVCPVLDKGRGHMSSKE